MGNETVCQPVNQRTPCVRTSVAVNGILSYTKFDPYISRSTSNWENFNKASPNEKEHRYIYNIIAHIISNLCMLSGKFLL